MAVSSPANVQVVAPYKPEHPLLPVPSRAQAEHLIASQGVEAWNELMRRRNAAIRREEELPLEYGHEPPTWALADFLAGFITADELAQNRRVPAPWIECARSLEARPDWSRPGLLLILGGNRAGKTRYMMRTAVKHALGRDGAIIWAFHESGANSITYHQGLVWTFMPPDVREAGKSKDAYVAYSQQNGFSSGKVTFRNASQVEFRNYQQDPTTIEGGELGAADRRPCVGFVADELLPASWLATLKFRLATREASGVVGFTAIDGYTPTVAMFLDGAQTILREEEPSILDSHGRPETFPFVQIGADPTMRTISFFTRFNPYGGYESVKRLTRGDPKAVRVVRLTGTPHKVADTRFPRFSVDRHVVPAARIPKDGTRWMILDPAGSKNWVMLWVIVDPLERVWVYREWPTPDGHVPGVGKPGPWALPGQDNQHKHDGVPGPAQKSWGFGLAEYKEVIARAEGWEDAGRDGRIEAWRETNGVQERTYLRYMDSRFAAAPSLTASGNTTLLEECAALGLYFEPAPGGVIDEGVTIINDALAWSEGEGTQPRREPKLYISDECQNLIFALKTWTGLDGTRGATKDFIDLLRYALTAPVYYCEGGSKGPSGGAYGAGVTNPRDPSRKRPWKKR